MADNHLHWPNDRDSYDCWQAVLHQQQEQAAILELIMNKLHLLDAKPSTTKDVAERKNPDASPCIDLQTAEAAGNMWKKNPLVVDESDATHHSVAPLEGGVRRSARLQHLLASKQDNDKAAACAISFNEDPVRIFDRDNLPVHPFLQHPDRPLEGGTVVTTLLQFT